MIKITNKTSGPIQLVVRSNPENGKSFTVLNIPGKGKNKNFVYLEDEKYTDYIDRAKKAGFIEVSQIINKKEE